MRCIPDWTKQGTYPELQQDIGYSHYGPGIHIIAAGGFLLLVPNSRNTWTKTGCREEVYTACYYGCDLGDTVFSNGLVPIVSA